jgi:hypothetical protein
MLEKDARSVLERLIVSPCFGAEGVYEAISQIRAESGDGVDVRPPLSACQWLTLSRQSFAWGNGLVSSLWILLVVSLQIPYYLPLPKVSRLPALRLPPLTRTDS